MKIPPLTEVKSKQKTPLIFKNERVERSKFRKVGIAGLPEL